MITTDDNWHVVYANPVAQEWLGLKTGDNVEPVLQLRMPHTDTQIPFPDPELFSSAKAPVCKLLTQKGECYVRIGVLPLKKEGVGYTIVVWDVSAQYRSQKEAMAVFGALESLEEGLLLLHPQTEKVLFASKGFEKMTGWSAEEVVGEPPHFLFGAKTTVAFWQKVKQTLAEEGYVKTETILYTKAGKERMAQWQISRMDSEDSTADGQLIVFIRDVSEQRQVEEEYRQSQKIEAVGRLAGGVAHDFNNLLSVINSYADLLTLKLPEGDPLNKYVGNIRAAGQRAADLVAKLLTFSRRDTAKPAMLDVRAITDDVQKMLRRVIRENIEITLEYGDSLGALWADQLQLEQVLMNLCVNARDAITNSGTIRISWTMKAIDAATAAKKSIAVGDYLALSVSDTGSGMEPEVLSRIFEPYFTTKGAGKGTGLGLSIVYSIVKQLKGDIEVESTLGQGTTFRIYLPASARLAKTKSTVAPIEQPSQGNEHIMIVEDDENFADCLQSLLSIHGYKVHHARDAASALQLHAQSLYPIRLLITDMMLPGIPGHELAKQIKAKDSDVKVIFITGYENAVNILQDFPHTALVLQKPFSVVSILNKVREILDTLQNDKKIQII